MGTIEEKNCPGTSRKLFPIVEMVEKHENVFRHLFSSWFQSGFMPNVFSGLSYRPDELRAFLNYYEVVMAERGNADFMLSRLRSRSETQVLLFRRRRRRRRWRRKLLSTFLVKLCFLGTIRARVMKLGASTGA